jgi:hypothetical protein
MLNLATCLMLLAPGSSICLITKAVDRADRELKADVPKGTMHTDDGQSHLSRTPRSAGTKLLCGEKARLTSWSAQWAWLRLAMRLRLRLLRLPVLKSCSSRSAGSSGRLARSSLLKNMEEYQITVLAHAICVSEAANCA